MLAYADESSRATMNIVTYASPVALQPPVYALGLYKSTQSAANWRVHRRGLLQAGAVGVTLLAPLTRQSGLILVLCRKHGLHGISWCQSVSEWYEAHTLTGCAADGRLGDVLVLACRSCGSSTLSWCSF